LTLSGHPEEAIQYSEAAINLNPLNPRIPLYRGDLARAFLDAHRYEDAVDQAREVVRRGRAYRDEHLVLASALGHLGQAAAAKAVLDEQKEYRETRISEITLCPWAQLYQSLGPNEHLLEGLRKAGIPD